MLYYIKISTFLLSWVFLVQKIDGVHTSNRCEAFSNSIVSCYSSQVILVKDKRESGTPLWYIVGVRSVVQCAIICSQDINCVSYFYHKDDRSCSGHSIVFTNASPTVTYLGNRYYLFDGVVVGNIGDSCSTSSECITENAECRVSLCQCVSGYTLSPSGNTCDASAAGNIGDSCSSSPECITENAECRANQCQCVSGYSFSPSEHTCSASCVIYGTTFTGTLGYYISGLNEDIIFGVSYDECVALCVSQTAYTCKTFDYGESLNDCYLQSVTKLDRPERFDNSDPGYDYYQRNCV